jgi:two-component system, OmpR family, catabolic regulation response regulator CreB
VELSQFILGCNRGQRYHVLAGFVAPIASISTQCAKVQRARESVSCLCGVPGAVKMRAMSFLSGAPPSLPHVLLLEDEPSIAHMVIYAFERAGLRVTHSLLVRDALRQIATAAPDLLVLDVGLPDGSGLDVCRAIRANPASRHIPVLMLSAHGEEIDRVLGLELGADDYVTKPFSPRELVARVRGLLRRFAASPVEAGGSPASEAEAAAAAHGLEIDRDGQRAILHGQLLPLTRREFGLLAELLRHPGRIRSREALLEAVWGNEADVTDRTVDTHVKTLRAKLQRVAPACDCIETHRGMGYAFGWPQGGTVSGGP